MDFLIFCPPRSRSAWLANFLTYGNSYCYHEALATVTRLEELKNMKKNGKTIGDSDSGLFFFAEKVLKTAPDAKIVLIKREKDDIKKALMKLFDPSLSEHIAKACGSAGNWLEKVLGVLVVKYDDLNKESTCRKIWEFCVPHEMFDSERWKMLSNFNVQLHEISFDMNRANKLVTSERGEEICLL